MTFTVGDLTDFLQQLFTVLLAGGAIYLGVRKWVKRVAASSEAAATQVKTSNGKTLAEYTESTARDISGLKSHITELTQATQENRDRSVRAETLATSAHERLDKHLIHDHGVHLTPREPEEN